MADPLASLVGVVTQLIDRFEASGLAYAFGGAVAYSSWGEPRATRDVDLNVSGSTPIVSRTPSTSSRRRA